MSISATSEWPRSPPLPTYHHLTFDRGLVYAARFAPGGRSIHYSASWNGEPVQLYSTLPDAPESRPLNLGNSTLFAVSASQLAISAGCKDRYIGLCQGTLGPVPLAGGTPRKVADGVLAADWSADGSEMALILQVEGKYRVEFPRGKTYFQDIPRGAPRAVTPVISVKRHHFEGHNLSPDGRTFFARDLSERDGLYPLAGGEPRLIPDWLQEDIWVAWAADGHRSMFITTTKLQRLFTSLSLRPGSGN